MKCVREIGRSVVGRVRDDDAFYLVQVKKTYEYCAKSEWKKRREPVETEKVES
jgi:hypothetical protein